MAAYVPATDTEAAFRVSKNTTKSVVMSFLTGGTMYYIFATTTTTVVEFRGLGRADALAMAESADYNYDNKHGVRFAASTSGPSAWMRSDMCEGDTCRADAKRINEADMWRVTVTYTSTTATHSAGWTKTTY